MTVKEILERLPKVNEKRNYWLVRTEGGTLYESFMTGNFIAIGYDKISLEEISVVRTNDEAGINILAEKIKSKYEDEKRAKHSARQLKKFTYEIKKNDIVLIPSQNSEEITFGQIEETSAFNNFDNKFNCPSIKRKKVRWLKTVSRKSLDPNLYKLMFSHHTISEANLYDRYIDKILNSFFIKNNQAHIVLDVQTTDDIKARSLFAMGDLALDVFDEFCKEEKLEYNSDNFEVKLAVQSPGFIELVGSQIGGIIIIGIILVGIAGGGFKFKYKKEVTTGIKTDGIIEKVRKFIQTNSNIKLKKELLEKHMDSLEIKDPKELINVLKELDK